MTITEALGFKTRSDMAKEPTAATTDKSMLQIKVRQFRTYCFSTTPDDCEIRIELRTKLDLLIITVIVIATVDC
jgi:hypothetical protein